MPVCRLVRSIPFLIVFCFCILLLTGCQDPGGMLSEPDPSVSGPDSPSAVPDSRPDAYSLIEPETPLTTVNTPSGIRTSIVLRLCSIAP